MFAHVVRQSLRHQASRSGLAVLVIVLGTAMASTLAHLSFDVGRQAGRELRAYGANALVLPPSGALSGVANGSGLAEADLATLDGTPGLQGYVPYLHLVGQVGGQAAVVAGVDFDRLHGLWPRWNELASWPAGPDEALLGVDLATALGLAPGSRVAVRYGEAERAARVVGLVQAGGPEDSQVLLPLATVQALAGRSGQVSLVELSVLGSGQELDRTLAIVQAALPSAQVRLLRQYAGADESVLLKVRLLVGLVAVLVLASAAVAMAATTLTAVLERRTEIGLLKALGASGLQVAGLFVAEGLAVGAVGGLIGAVVGLGLASLIGWQVFQTTLQPNPPGLLLSVLLAEAVVFAAIVWPVRRALAVDPATTLRGE